MSSHKTLILKQKRTNLMNNNPNLYPNQYYIAQDSQQNNYSTIINSQQVAQLENQMIIDQMKKYNDTAKVINEFSKNKLNEIRKNQLIQKQIELSYKKITKIDMFPVYRYNSKIELPSKIVNTMKNIHKLTKLDQVGIVCALLGTASIGTQGRVIVKLHENWKEPAIDMHVQVAPSGCNKTALNRILRNPIDKYSEYKNRLRNENILRTKEKTRITIKTAEKSAMQIVKSKIKDLCSNGETMLEIGIDNIESELNQAIDHATNISLRLKKNIEYDQSNVILLIDDATPYKTAMLLQDQGECLGVITAEGSILKSSIISSKGAPKLFLHAHTQEPYVYPHGNIQLLHPSLPMINFVQPNIAKELYTDKNTEGQGVTERFVPYCHSTSRNIESDDIVPDNAFDIYKLKIIKLLELYHTQNRHAKKYFVSVNPDALALVIKFQQEIKDEIIPSMPKEAESCLLKAHGQAVRFAWDIHAWNYDEPHKFEITLTEMQQAIEIVRNIFNHIYYFYDPCGLQAYSAALKIIETILRISDNNEKWFILNEGQNSTWIQQRIGLKSKEANNALRLLENHNYLAIYDDGSNNLKFTLHPCFFSHNFENLS